MSFVVAGKGESWSDRENELLVQDYFEMLEEQIAGRPYNKKARGRALVASGVDRSPGSIDLKRMNVSAICERLAVNWVRGLVPRENCQASLVAAVEGHLRRVGIDRYDRVPGGSRIVGTRIAGDVFVDVPVLNRPNRPERDDIRRIVRKFDPVERDHRNRELGRAGEEFVVDVETDRLRKAGRGDLADRIRWVARDDGDGAGYDVGSFSIEGEPRCIEVKTTRGGIATPFFLTLNELDVSRELDVWRLYRVHCFGTDPRIYEVVPPIDGRLALSPALWQAVPV